MNHIQSATEELLIIFSTAKAFYRQLVLRGIMQLCKKAASERNVKTRILTPRDERIDKIVQELLQEQEHLQQQRGRSILDISNHQCKPELQFKYYITSSNVR